MLSSSGYWKLSQPATCSGDQSKANLLATMLRNFPFRASKQDLGRSPDSQATLSALLAREAPRPPCLEISRLTVDAARPIRSAIERPDSPEAIPRELSSRSTNVSARLARVRTLGTIPPRWASRLRIDP